MDIEVPKPYTSAELWLVQNHVVAVRTSYKMITEDSSEDYIELESMDGKKVKWQQTTFNRIAKLRVCGTNLVELNYGVREAVEKRLKYERTNQAELATYKRLKAKFEG